MPASGQPATLRTTEGAHYQSAGQGDRSAYQAKLTDELLFGALADGGTVVVDGRGGEIVLEYR
jgi:hypothetical protein